MTAFNNLRNELVSSLNTLVADENTAQATYNARVIQLNTEHNEFQRTTLFRNAEITRTKGNNSMSIYQKSLRPLNNTLLKESQIRPPSRSNSKPRTTTTPPKPTHSTTSLPNTKENSMLPVKLLDYSLNHHSKTTLRRGEDFE